MRLGDEGGARLLLLAAVLGAAACSNSAPAGGTGGTTNGGPGGSALAQGGGSPGGHGGGTSGSGGAGGTGGGSGSASPCPYLAGVFDCPKFGNQPPYTLTVSQTDDPATGGVTYAFHYSHNDMTNTFAASAEGSSKSGYVAQCVEYMSDAALAFYSEGKPEQATYNFINAQDDFEAQSGGSTAIICERQ